MTAPTTRETADHAELAGCPFCGGPHLKHIAVSSEDEPTWQIAWQVFCETCHARGPASVRIGWCETEPDASFAWNRRPGEAALLSEIASLRDERDHFEAEFRRQCGATADQMDLSERAARELDAVSGAIGTVRFMDPPDGGDVPLSEQVRRMSSALTQAERQRDEAVGLLREWMGTWFVDADSRGESAIADDTRKYLLANQGADQ